MSNWNERERKILKIEIGGAEKRFDPLKIVLQYNRAVRDEGGPETMKAICEAYFKRGTDGKPILPDQNDPIAVHKHNLQQAEAAAYLGKVGLRTFAEKEFDPETGEGMTLEEARDMLYQFWDFSAKKEIVEENSPTSDTQELPTQPGETSGGKSATPNTSLPS